MWSLHYIEDTTAPPDKQILLGLHRDEASAYLAFAFVTDKMEGVYIMSPGGVIVHDDAWARQVFRPALTVLNGGAK